MEPLSRWNTGRRRPPTVVMTFSDHRKINVTEFPGGDLVGPVGPAAIPGNRVVGLHLLTLERSAGWALYDAAVQLGGEPVDLPGQLRVGLEFKLLLGEVVVGLRLLERRLPVLADHHKR